jgi:hypothetical protein
VRHSVDVYYQYVQQNRLLFLFISSERAGAYFIAAHSFTCAPAGS